MKVYEKAVILNISEAATLSGLPTKPLRYYEEIGLVVPPRGDNSYRMYSVELVGDLILMRRARQVGFSVKDSAELLDLFRNPQRQSREVNELANQKLIEMDRHIDELTQMRGQLRKLPLSCANDESPECDIIKSLAGGV